MKAVLNIKVKKLKKPKMDGCCSKGAEMMPMKNMMPEKKASKGKKK